MILEGAEKNKQFFSGSNMFQPSLMVNFMVSRSLITGIPTIWGFQAFRPQHRSTPPSTVLVPSPCDRRFVPPYLHGGLMLTQLQSYSA
jgi:hypothetical protein